MKRLAYCSPVNPLTSGISDYSEELVPYLARYVDVVLFVPDGVTPTNHDLTRHLDVRPMADLARLNKTAPFDAIVYHLGNSPVHAEIYEHALRLPGVVVLHEWVLHHFKLWYAATRRGDIRIYRREMAERYGEQGAAIGGRMARGQLLDTAFDLPLVEDVVAAATGLIGHSRYVVEHARVLRPALPAEVIPMGVPLPPAIEPGAARRQLGLPDAAPIWASFGHINPYKRMEAALRAFRRFRRSAPDARYLLVGSVSPSYDLGAVIRRLDLEHAVHVTGYVSAAQFALCVAASDLCLNLRWPTAGETSASLLRLLGAGRPTLVTATGAFEELPDDVCAKVDVGAAEQEQIWAYGRLMQSAPPIAVRLGANARRFVAMEHSLERAARGYIDFLARLHSWGAVPPWRAALWDVAGEARILDAAPLTAVPRPSVLAPSERSTPVGLPVVVDELARDVGAALGELGVEPQSPAAAAAARAVGDLFEAPS